jgi:hypothetical protein
MDFIEFADVSFLPKSSIGKLCEDLNSAVGNVFGTIHFKFKIQSGCGWLTILLKP